MTSLIDRNLAQLVVEGGSRGKHGWLEKLQLWLLLGVGLSLPLYAFPVARVFGKLVDPATVLAAVFVGTGVVRWRPWLRSSGERILVVGAILAPLLALLPPRPHYFEFGAFAASYGHWLLISFFFLVAISVELPEYGRRSLAVANVGMAFCVALFGLYQAVGILRHWPGTGPRLLPMQREDFRFMALGSSYVRPTSIFLEPSWFGGYLCWCLALALAAWASASGRHRVAWSTAALLLVIAMISTVSLGTYADLAVLTVAFSIVAARTGRPSRRALGRAATVLGVVLLCGALSPWGRSIGNALAYRYRNLVAVPRALRQANPDLQESSWIRIRNVSLTVEVLQTRPLLGIGLGQFVRSLPPGRRNPLFPEERWCGWLAITAEIGLLGPLLLAGALLLVWRRRRTKSRADLAPLAVPVLLAIATVLQIHTGSYIDLWWWYPVSLAGVLTGPTAPPETHSVEGSAVSSP